MAYQGSSSFPCAVIRLPQHASKPAPANLSRNTPAGVPKQYSVRVPSRAIHRLHVAGSPRSPTRLPQPVVWPKPAAVPARPPCTDLSRSCIRTSRAGICKSFWLADLAVNLADLCANLADPGATRAIASCGRHRPMRKACTCLPEACGPRRNTRGPIGKPCGPCREACTCLRATCGCLRGQGDRGRRPRSWLARITADRISTGCGCAGSVCPSVRSARRGLRLRRSGGRSGRPPARRCSCRR